MLKAVMEVQYPMMEVINALQKQFGGKLFVGKAILHENEDPTIHITNIDSEKGRFEFFCEQCGLEISDYLRTVVYNCSTYQICAIKPRLNRNLAVLREVSTGKLFNMPVEHLKRFIEME